MDEIRIENMNWMDIKEAIESGYKTVVVGVGSNEQHGPHLPTKTDGFIGDILSFEIAKKLGNALQAPAIRVGCSDPHLSFAGTISLRESTLKAIIEDYVNSLKRHGFTHMIFLPTHGGNFYALREVIDQLQKSNPAVVLFAPTDFEEMMEGGKELRAKLGVTPEEAGSHAGETETSMMLYFAEDLVKTDRFTPGFVGKFGPEQMVLWENEGMPAISDIGVIGDPRKSTKEHGKLYLDLDLDLDNNKIFQNKIFFEMYRKKKG